MKTTNWGIIGAGAIAGALVRALKLLPDANLVAVASRSLDRAQKFGEEHSVPKCYGRYEDLVNDPDVDVVYIATVNTAHKDNCVLALNAGKPVLCEKPFTVNAKEAEEVINLAREKNLFLMEAMWARFLPYMGKVREWLAAGKIGEPLVVQADVGFKKPFDPEIRTFKPEKGGGILLDMGPYALTVVSMAFDGAPTEIKGLAYKGATGVDELDAITLGYEGGKVAQILATARAHPYKEARIIGTGGRIRLVGPYWEGATAVLSVQGQEDETAFVPNEGKGFHYQILEVMECLEAGLTESKLMPLAETLKNTKIMDELRRQWDLKYPTE